MRKKRNKNAARLVAVMLCLAITGSGMPVYAESEIVPETEAVPTTYRLQLEQSEHGKLLANGTEDENMEFVAGETVTLQAVPEEGYELQEWEADGREVPGKETEISFFMPAQEVSIQASFIEKEKEKSLQEPETGSSSEERTEKQTEEQPNPVLEVPMISGKEEMVTARLQLNSKAALQSLEANARASIYIQNSGTIQYPADIGSAYEWDYWVDGQIAYCVNPQMAGPESGYYSSSIASEISNQALAKVFFYGYRGTGDITASVIGGDASRRHVVTHIAAAIAYGDSNPYYNCTQAGIDAANQFYAAALAQPDLPAGSCRLIRLHAADGMQDIVYLIVDIQYGNLVIQKSSSNPAISDNNSCYSLEGAVFTVYQAGTDQVVGTITTDVSGYGHLEHLQTGNYEIQETTAPKGFLIDNTRHTVSISGNRTFTYYFADEPGSDPIIVLLLKKDVETGKAQGSAKLEGAEYTVKYYDTNMSTDPAEIGMTAKYAWVLESDTNGRTYLDNTHKVSGDEFILGLHGRPVLPLGTITVQETRAPEGYEINPQIYVANTTLQGASSVVTTNLPNTDTYYATEQVIRGDLEFLKTDKETGAVMAGIPFRITSETTGESHVIVTDETGQASTELANHSWKTNKNDEVTDESNYSPSFGIWFGESDPDDTKGALPYDTYTLEELPCSANYGKDLLVLGGIPVKEAGVSIDLGELTNQTIHIKSEAVDAKTGTHTIAAERDARITDNYIIQGLTAGRTYRLAVTARDAKTGVPIEKNGVPVTSETTVVSGGNSASATVELLLDTYSMAGTAIVCTADLYWMDQKIASHEDLLDQAQTVYVPTIGTTAKDGQTQSHTGSVGKETTLIDIVAYTGLTQGKEYEVTGTLMVRETGEELLASGEPVTTKTTFIPKERDGTVELVFSFDSSSLAGQTVVAFEEIIYKGIHVISHAEIDDAGQSVHYPEIGTVARAAATGDAQVIISEKTTLLDTVSLTNLVPGETYTLKGRLMDRETGEPLLVNEKEVTAETTFTAENASGSLELSFTFDAFSCRGKTFVVFEELYCNAARVASEADLANENQTVYLPDLKTMAADQQTGTHTGTIGPQTVIVDTVLYSNLLPGKEYSVFGKLMLQSTGEPFLMSGKEVTAETTFIAENTSGSVELSFTIDSSSLWGETLVVFEDLYREGLLLVSHADLEDEAQSVRYPKLGYLTVGGGSGAYRLGHVATGDGKNLHRAGESLALAATMLVCLILWRKRQRKACTVKEEAHEAKE